MFSSGYLIRTMLFATAFLSAEQPPSGEGVPVSILVTVEGHKNSAPHEVTPKDALVYQGGQRIEVTGWTSAQSASVGLQLWVLFDDGSDTVLGTELPSLKKFVESQPSTTQIGIGYLRNGSVLVGQNLTTDHELAARAIRLPIGAAGISASPYLALIELIEKKWPDSSSAREVLLVTSGIDPDYGPGPDNPYLLRAIDVAQRARVVVNAIYFGGAGHLGHSHWQITWGQNNLSRIADQTGGEFYWQGTTNPVSLAPYLDDLTRRMQAQYVLTFLAMPRATGGFQSIRLRTEVPQTSLVGQDRVYVLKSK